MSARHVPTKSFGVAKSRNPAIIANYRNAELDKCGQNAGNPPVRLCTGTQKALVLLVELTRIERAIS